MKCFFLGAHINRSSHSNTGSHQAAAQLVRPRSQTKSKEKTTGRFPCTQYLQTIFLTANMLLQALLISLPPFPPLLPPPKGAFLFARRLSVEEVFLEPLAASGVRGQLLGVGGIQNLRPAVALQHQVAEAVPGWNFPTPQVRGSRGFFRGKNGR